MCIVLLPPGVNPIAVDKYIINILILRFWLSVLWASPFHPGKYEDSNYARP